MQGALKRHSGLEQVKGAKDPVQERDEWLSVQKPLEGNGVESSVVDVGKGMIIVLQGLRQMSERAVGQEGIGTMDRT